MYYLQERALVELQQTGRGFLITSSQNQSNPFNNVMNTLTINFPWIWSMLLGVSYIAVFFVYAREPSRNKFMGITFLGLIISTIFRMYGLVGNIVWLGGWGLVILSYVVIRLT